MIRNKKVLNFIAGVIITSLLASSSALKASAQTVKPIPNINIQSADVPSDIVEYGIEKYKAEINIINNTGNNSMFSSDDYKASYLGTPFSLYDYKNNHIVNSNVYYFPIINNNKIISFLTISKDENGKYIATLSNGFANKLNDVINDNNRDKLQIVGIENVIYTIDESDDKSTLLANYNNKNIEISNETVHAVTDLAKSDDNSSSEKFVNIENKLVSANESINSSKKSLTNKNNKVMEYSSNSSAEDYKLLKVPVVGQGRAQWCTSASCATILNYKKGLSLTAKDVASYIQGKSDPDTNLGATPGQARSAYSHYGYDTTIQFSQLPFVGVRAEIGLDRPVNAFCFDRTVNPYVGHSMVIVGYYRNTDTVDYCYVVADPNFPGKYFLVLADLSSGKFTYHLGSYKLTWEDSVY
ncbi:C39 family peptidase [Clostridium sp. HBUAS56017]|uniref:C39 family peptidase n=1 Tax=Clostridium sp. HBUAS56017 TaxID=2571128 RepID=UPI0011776EB3|nr:C39 family peptidase [Clostridium sp. HBUAS56017]